jgi:hypothetical protein
MLIKPAPHRRRTALLIASILLFFGALTLVITGYRTMANWAVLVSTFITMVFSMMLWRSKANRYPVG